MEAGIEVLPVGGRSRRNRKWPDEDASSFQSGHQRGGGKARVDPHHGHVAKAPPGAVDHVEDHIERTFGGADIARPQPGIQTRHHPGHDAAAFQHLPQKHRPGVPGQTISPPFDPQRPVETRNDWL